MGNSRMPFSNTPILHHSPTRKLMTGLIATLLLMALYRFKLLGALFVPSWQLSLNISIIQCISEVFVERGADQKITNLLKIAKKSYKFVFWFFRVWLEVSGFGCQVSGTTRISRAGVYADHVLITRCSESCGHPSWSCRGVTSLLRAEAYLLVGDSDVQPDT